MMSLQIDKHSRREEDGVTRMELVAGNEDLLTLILFRLPVRSLLRFKSVSKHWLSLISNPQFCVLKTKRCCKHISGILLNPRHKRDTLKFQFVGLDNDCHGPFETLDFVGARTRLNVLHYCNGLLLCQPHTEIKRYYVINPTTRQHTMVPLPVKECVHSVALAFDPRKSPNFKLICLFRLSSPKFRLEIYSSETDLVTSQLSDLFTTSCYSLGSHGVYWNGDINWINYHRDGLYFNVDEERFGVLPMPPVPRGCGRTIAYYGESNDHLYLVLIETSRTMQFDVYEMDKEYKDWFVRFHVDLRPMFRALPTEEYNILAIVDKDEGENSFIVFGLSCKAV